MHDKKVNTKTTGVTSSALKNVVLQTPYGQLHMDSLGARDHASMRARGLEAILTLIGGEGQRNFACLTDDLQTSVIWTMQQFSDELVQLLDQMEFANVEVAK